MGMMSFSFTDETEKKLREYHKNLPRPAPPARAPSLSIVAEQAILDYLEKQK